MAKDKDTNQDPEEEKDDQFDDDEDFGLPDLSYDELEDDDDDEPLPEEVAPPLEEISEEFETEEKEEEAPVADTPPAEETPIPAPAEASSGEEPGGDDFDISEEDLDEQLKKELEDADMNESDFYEEESFDDFEDDNASSSIFGVDEKTEESSYEQVAEPTATTSSAPQYTSAHQTNTYSGQNEQKKGTFGTIVVVGALAFGIIATALWWFFVKDNESSTKKPVATKTITKKKAPVKVKKKAKPAATTPKPAATKPKPAPKKAAPAQPQRTPPSGQGTVTKLETATGKSYVVVASFFDEDLAMDHAKELAGKGENPKVIPPFKDHRYYRVTIAEYDTYSLAEGSLAQYKGNFGEQIWALRY
ncbi:MAG: SPOR domain-containing protein [Cyclobacteriaceae bacterium]|nr:SPOR domain-containing protein [Cyclobacteriaceae bacterium HetDA_MAG_MS6]